jgi:hypothetical protein
MAGLKSCAPLPGIKAERPKWADHVASVHVPTAKLFIAWVVGFDLKRSFGVRGRMGERLFRFWWRASIDGTGKRRLACDGTAAMQAFRPSLRQGRTRMHALIQRRIEPFSIEDAPWV